MQVIARKFSNVIVFFCCAISLLSASVAFAVSQEQAASIVQAHTNGKVLDTKFVKENNKDMYHVKVITTDNRVIIVKVNATSGEVLL